MKFSQTYFSSNSYTQAHKCKSILKMNCKDKLSGLA